MKKLAVVFASFLLVAAFSTASYAQNTSADASARIITPLEINKVQDLLFGNIAAGPTAGTVVIATDDNRTHTGGVTLISAGNTSHAAEFGITGYPDASFTIDIPTSIKLEFGANEMDVDNFESSLGAASSLDEQGEANLKVGATLNVEANQEAGLYQGSFEVTVAYN